MDCLIYADSIIPYNRKNKSHESYKTIIDKSWIGFATVT